MLANELTTFAQLVETLSFTKTAAKQNSTQATISRRIKELEQTLSLQLVKRNTRNITITDAGLKLYEGIKKQEIELQSLIGSLHKEKARAEGTIRVSLPHALAYALISPYIGEFLRDNPGIVLHLFYQNHTVNLVNDHFDLALVSYMPKHQTTIVKLMYKFTAQLYCSPAYIKKYGEPKELAELEKHTIGGWIYNDFSVPKHLHIRNTLTEEITIMDNGNRVVSNSALHSAPLATHGEMIVGAWDYLVKKELEAGELVKLLPDYTFGETPYYLITLPNSKNTIINLFINFIENCFKRL